MPFKSDLFREAFCGTQGGYSVNVYLIKVNGIIICDHKRREMRTRLYTLPHHLILGESDASSVVILKCLMSALQL